MEDRTTIINKLKILQKDIKDYYYKNLCDLDDMDINDLKHIYKKTGETLMDEKYTNDYYLYNDLKRYEKQFKKLKKEIKTAIKYKNKNEVVV